jgi:hypothetical protein
VVAVVARLRLLLIGVVVHLLLSILNFLLLLAVVLEQ